MAEKPIGTLIHYFDKLGVGVIKLAKPLKVGDVITVQRGEHTFSQIVQSLQIDHEEIRKAKKGMEVGIKLKEEAKAGSLVLAA